MRFVCLKGEACGQANGHAERIPIMRTLYV